MCSKPALAQQVLTTYQTTFCERPLPHTFPRPATARKIALTNSSGPCPLIESGFHPVRDGHRANVATLADQILHRPVPLTHLDLIQLQADQLGSAKATTEQHGHDNAPGSPQAVQLSGTGQDFSLAPKGSATVTVAPGQTATYTVTVTPSGGFNQSVDLSCTGAPLQSTCTVSSSVTLDGVNPSMVTVSVVTTASAMGLTQPLNAPPISGTFGLWLELSGILGLCVLATLRGRGHARRPQLICGVTLVCFLSMGITTTACGGGGGGSSGSGGTQAGTYTVTVTGTSSVAKLTNKTNLTLVVQ